MQVSGTDNPPMSLAIVYSRAQSGIHAPLVTVEVHLDSGLPSLAIVGLPQKAVRESKDRVRSAISQCGFDFPGGRITINLAPADLPKDGGRFDLAIAIGILAADGLLPSSQLDHYEFIGELALGGQLRPVRGVLPASLQCRDTGRQLVVPAMEAAEARLVQGSRVLAAEHLMRVCEHLRGYNLLPLEGDCVLPAAGNHGTGSDLSDIKGQQQGKRALEIAAAGGHSLLMSGPPGAGKTMLASRLPGLLPGMDEQEAIESAIVASVSDRGFDFCHWRRRPFRAPHHTASAVALVGGGNPPRPGEISLAHHGVLFLDELPEFDRKVLEVLREPLESGQVVISRAARQVSFMARFQLVAAMNPCPCGYLGHDNGRCHCSPEQIRRYRGRLSGPLLDRIDMHLAVPALTWTELALAPATTDSSARVRERVLMARERQLRRSDRLNSRLDAAALEQVCAIDRDGHALLAAATERFTLSARAVHRILKLARTIADLAGEEAISAQRLAEAVAYRQPDGGG